jgi:hypothetical protein
VTVRVRALTLLSKTNIRRRPRTAPSEIAESGVSACSFRHASGRSPLAPYLLFYRQAAGWLYPAGLRRWRFGHDRVHYLQIFVIGEAVAAWPSRGSA